MQLSLVVKAAWAYLFLSCLQLLVGLLLCQLASCMQISNSKLFYRSLWCYSVLTRLQICCALDSYRISIRIRCTLDHRPDSGTLDTCRVRGTLDTCRVRGTLDTCRIHVALSILAGYTWHSRYLQGTWHSRYLQGTWHSRYLQGTWHSRYLQDTRGTLDTCRINVALLDISLLTSDFHLQAITEALHTNWLRKDSDTTCRTRSITSTRRLLYYSPATRLTLVWILKSHLISLVHLKAVPWTVHIRLRGQRQWHTYTEGCAL